MPDAEASLLRVELPCLGAFPVHLDVVGEDASIDPWRRAWPRVDGLAPPFDGPLRVGSHEEVRARVLLAHAPLREALADVLHLPGVRGVGFAGHALHLDLDVATVGDPPRDGWEPYEAHARRLGELADAAAHAAANHRDGRTPRDPTAGRRARPLTLLVLAAGLWVAFALGGTCLWGGAMAVPGWVTVLVAVGVAGVPAWLLDRLDRRITRRGRPPALIPADLSPGPAPSPAPPG